VIGLTAAPPGKQENKMASASAAHVRPDRPSVTGDVIRARFAAVHQGSPLPVQFVRGGDTSVDDMMFGGEDNSNSSLFQDSDMSSLDPSSALAAYYKGDMDTGDSDTLPLPGEDKSFEVIDHPEGGDPSEQQDKLKRLSLTMTEAFGSNSTTTTTSVSSTKNKASFRQGPPTLVRVRNNLQTDLPYPFSVLLVFVYQLSLVLRMPTETVIDGVALFLKAQVVADHLRVPFPDAFGIPSNNTTVAYDASVGISSSDVGDLESYLHKHTLDFLSTFVWKVMWCIEKAWSIVQSRMLQGSRAAAAYRRSLFDVLRTTEMCDRFVAVCRHVYQDTRVRAGRVYMTGEMIRLAEVRKEAAVDWFAQLTSDSLRTFTVAPRTDKAPLMLPNARVELFRQTLRDDDEEGNTVVAREMRALPLTMDAYPPQPRRAYLFRLLNEACNRQLSNVEYELVFEESNLPEDVSSATTAMLASELAGPVYTDYASALELVNGVHPFDSRVQLIQQILTDRTWLVRFVDLVACIHAQRGIEDRSKATITPQVARWVDGSKLLHLTWFRMSRK
jgi:hypothetical protein